MNRPAALLTVASIFLTSFALGDISLTVKSMKQGGNFKGEGVGAATGRIPVLSFEYLVRSPRDPMTGKAMSRNTQGSIKIVKEWGASSPLFHNALTANELLPSLEFYFIKIDTKTGQQVVFQQVTLTNVVVAEIRQFVESDTGASGNKHYSSANQRFLEEITLIYTDLVMTNHEGKTTTGDSASGPKALVGRPPARLPPPKNRPN